MEWTLPAPAVMIGPHLMDSSPPFDPAPAHRFFSAECFNRAWDLIDKADRSAEEDDEMRALCHASLWHWTQR
ncbi:MAG: hypothetical protein KDM64_03820, partial [Verrucomicrobiae bacterium]|nr:hypothetical protein [Verrucomicrobiae bacterium]